MAGSKQVDCTPVTVVYFGGIVVITHCCSKFLYKYLIAGFNVETVSYKNINFTTLDVGGRDKIISKLYDGLLDIPP